MLNNFDEMLWRSWRYALSLKKLLLVTIFLFIALTVFTFCQSIAATTGPWVKTCLFFLPFFVVSGFTLSLSIYLSRIYWREIRGNNVGYKSIARKSWELFLTSSFISVPLFLLFLVLWVLIGVFYLIHEIPMFGGFLGSLLSFAPFLLILATLLLTVGTVVMLFVIPPSLALEKKDKHFWMRLKDRILSLLPSYTFFFFVGILPLLLTGTMIFCTYLLTDYLFVNEASQLLKSFQWFILNLPVAGFLALPFIFFVNFALETHVQLIKHKKELTFSGSNEHKNDHKEDTHSE